MTKMEIHSVADLESLEERIRTAIGKHRLEEVLLGIQRAPPEVPPFVRAGLALFAARFCSAGHRLPRQAEVGWPHLARIADMVTEYQLADPLTFDQETWKTYLRSNPVFAFLRMSAGQMPYNISLYGRFGQPLMLFDAIPKRLAQRTGPGRFDFATSFQRTCGLPLIDFLTVGFVALAAAHQHGAFTRADFDSARTRGLGLPSDDGVLLALDHLAADPQGLARQYHHFRNSDRRFAMYDLNPLLTYPIIRPWRQRGHLPAETDRMIAPIPNLIAFRISMGIFYQMYNKFGPKFSDYFGDMFSAYVGFLLENSVPPSALLSEDAIRSTYHPNDGKVPDWVVLDGNTAVLVECKSTRFSRNALSTGDEAAVNDSLKQVLKGLRQLHEFRTNCIERRPGLEAIGHCTCYVPILVTLEPLYLVNSPMFHQYIDGLLADNGITGLPWQILSIDQLETLQPHLHAGSGFSATLRELSQEPFADVLVRVSRDTGLTYRDSCLYDKDRELYQKLGLVHPD